MTDKRVVDEIITKFLFNTCRLGPRLSEPVLQAVVSCASAVSYHSPTHEHAEFIPLITGSVAEFYIEPMLPHVGDIDTMSYPNNMLAIPRGHPPPTQLPAEFHDYVNVQEIVDSHLSGYVYLRLRYLLTKCTDNGKYNYLEYQECGQYSSMWNESAAERHGPALLQVYKNGLLEDLVFCVRCLSWPPQAVDWPTRHRSYGWPDSATIYHVANNGCDVVQIAHRQCKQHEWMSKHLWRLSFSRAEILLINSWMPVQQIVYHLLRVVMKTEKFTESVDNSVLNTLSNYHIKTLMLWACELKSLSWWTDDLNLVRICVELLHTLAVWLTEARCPHYFISSCNLVDQSYVVETTAARLLLINDDYLSAWFVSSYIKQSVQICPENISRLFDDVSTSYKLENAVSAVVNWRLNTTTDVLCRDFYSVMCHIVFYVNAFSVSERICNFWMSALLKTDARLFIYLSAVVFLHVVQKIRSGGLTKNLLKAVAIITSLNKRTFSLLNEVAILARECQAQVVDSADCNTSGLVELLQQSAVELLTTFRKVEARDFASVVTVVTTDFEALYAYKHGDYQRCLHLSTEIVQTLFNPEAKRLTTIPIFPEFVQFLDDDIVSLTALTLIINPKCRQCIRYANITQLTLSLYLMTQCQLKLRHSLASLAQTLDYIEDAQRIHSCRHCTLDQLVLKLTERKAVTYISSSSNLS